jgi:hypothetical protein
MSASDHPPAALQRLFHRKPVVTLDELRKALGTHSRTAVFRVVRSIGYRTSFSHAGRFYTLADIPTFDARGLWFYRGIGFSEHGTLRATIVVLVDRSLAGLTHEELQADLTLRVYDTLRILVQDGLLGREEVDEVYVYVSAQREIAAAQLAKRRAALASAARPPRALDPARTIDVLVAVIHHPRDDPKAIVARLETMGRSVSIEQVEDLFHRYDLPGKKTARYPSRRSPPL